MPGQDPEFKGNWAKPSGVGLGEITRGDLDGTRNVRETGQNRRERGWEPGRESPEYSEPRCYSEPGLL